MKGKLGYGSDGTVWTTSRKSALKILGRPENYASEVEYYRRLREADTDEICGFAVPRLLECDEELLAIEMSIVQPPYLLDFGKVHLDHPPPYWGDAQFTNNAFADGREHFGRDWSKVLAAMTVLRSKFGIYYVDPRPGNISFGREYEGDDV